jgi:hypothetical protein
VATVVRRHDHLAAVPAQDAVGFDERTVAVCVGTGVAAAILFWLVHRALIDDAYITLSYARNLGFHFHWGLIEKESANTATSPLFVMLLGGTTAIVRNAMLALGIVFVTTYVVLAWWMLRTIVTLRLPVACAVLAVALLLFNPLLLSVVGMETTLIAALLVGLLDATVRERPLRFGVLSALCVLTRIDLVIFIVVIGLSSRVVRRRALAVSGTIAAICAPWFVWSWIHFGSAIPDTFVLKTLQHGFGTYKFTDGWSLYYQRVPTGTVVSFLAALLGAVTVVTWIVVRIRSRDPRDARFDPIVGLGIASAGYYVAYSLLDIAPYSWYYGPVIIGFSIALSLLLPELVRRAAQTVRRRRRLLLAVGSVLGALVLTELAVVVANGFPWIGRPIMYGNWASATEYERMGKQLRRIVGTQTVAGPGEIGTLAYYCRCTIVDPFSDRSRVIALVEFRVSRAEPVMRSLLEANFYNLDRTQLPRPAAYSLVVNSGVSHGGDVWNVSSMGRLNFRLVRSPADPGTIDPLVQGLLPALPTGRQLVLVGSRNADETIADAVAHAVRDRTHLEVRIDPGNQLPWVQHRRYHGARVSKVVTVAAGGAIDEMLRHPGTHVVGYWGNGPWSHRVAVKAQIAELLTSYRAGKLGAREYYVDTLEALKSLGPDVAVITS